MLIDAKVINSTQNFTRFFTKTQKFSTLFLKLNLRVGETTSWNVYSQHHDTRNTKMGFWVKTLKYHFCPKLSESEWAEKVFRFRLYATEITNILAWEFSTLVCRVSNTCGSVKLFSVFTTQEENSDRGNFFSSFCSHCCRCGKWHKYLNSRVIRIFITVRYWSFYAFLFKPIRHNFGAVVNSFPA